MSDLKAIIKEPPEVIFLSVVIISYIMIMKNSHQVIIQIEVFLIMGPGL